MELEYTYNRRRVNGKKKKVSDRPGNNMGGGKGPTKTEHAPGTRDWGKTSLRCGRVKGHHQTTGAKRKSWQFECFKEKSAFPWKEGGRQKQDLRFKSGHEGRQDLVFNKSVVLFFNWGKHGGVDENGEKGGLVPDSQTARESCPVFRTSQL